VAHFIEGSSEYNAYGGNPSAAWGQSVAMLKYVWQWNGDAIAAATYERCVPLDAVILTKTNWKSYDQLVPGEDETIGWNPEAGQSEWTRVLGISYYDDAPLVRLSNKSWSAECTPAHRWATRHWRRDGCAGPYRTEDVMTATDRLTSRHSIRLAAQANTGTGPAISEREAELLGWVLGDGSVAHIKAKPGSDPAHWRTGTGSRVSIRLYQSKPDHVRRIDALVEGMIFNRMARLMRTPSGELGLAPLVTWEFSRGYSAELLKRSGYDHKNPVPFLLSLSAGQRETFMRGVFGAEGSLSGGATFHNAGDFSGQAYARTKVYRQNDGPKQEAIILGVYLCGMRPGISERDNRGQTVGRWTVTTVSADIRETKPFIGGEKIRREDAGRGRVWCPQTELGSWTMRQGRQVMLTGNSDNTAASE
jgi:hypothetical protein